MKKILLAMFVALFSFNAKAQDYTNIVETDVVLGDITAPVTFIEYMSMTCGHCANFHENVFYKLNEEYIKTGKVAFVIREFPLDDLAMGVSKVIRCAPEDSFYNFLTAFLRTQKSWAYSDDKLNSIIKIAAVGGLSPEKVRSCIADKNLQALINKNRQSGIKLGVNSTPTSFINGKIYPGAKSYQQIKAIIETELAK